MAAAVTFASSSPRLDEGFVWAKTQAMAYVFEGDPVGPWYEAALPGRSAFCMRDVSHQCAGAQVLGLARHNANMLRKFAASIAESRDWCGYWEIDKWDRPAPVDYTDDTDFWYNLPANFDVLDACWRMFLWTGDRSYVDDRTFREFYDRTMTDYVAKWDCDGDGIVEGNPAGGRRGVGSYNEEVDLSVAADLVLRQHLATLDYADLQDLRGEHGTAQQFRYLAGQIAAIYRTRWWNPDTGKHRIGFTRDGTELPGPRCGRDFLLADEMPTQAALEELRRPSYENVEELSYIPEILFRRDLDEDAYDALLRIIDPSLKRREYPEVSFAAVGTVAEGLMGIAPDAREPLVATRPHLAADVEWAEMRAVPVLGNTITVRHEGVRRTTLGNLTGPEIVWRATFRGMVDTILVDGDRSAEKSRKFLSPGGQGCSFVDIQVPPGAVRTAQLP